MRALTFNLPSWCTPNSVLLSGLLTISVLFLGFGPRPYAPAPIPAEVADAIAAIQSSGLVPQAEEHIVQNEPPSTAVNYSVKPGESLSAVWRNLGAPSAGATKLQKAWDEAGIKGLRAGEGVTVLQNEREIVEFSRTLPNGTRAVAKGNSKEGYQVEIKKISVMEIPRTVTGFISTSFSSAARASSVPYSVIDELVDLFGARLEFRKDLQPGDSYTITYIERRGTDTLKELAPGPITSASIHSRGQMLAAIRHVGNGGIPRYYDERGSALGSYFLRYPLQFTRISSVFSGARFHPVLKRSRAHNGVDFAAPTGTPVRSVGDGVVVEAGYRGEGGNTVIIAHGTRYSTAYLHLSKINPSVVKGARVSRGEVIGAVGATGLATGPHLHFSLFDRGTYVDPLNTPLPSMSPDTDAIPQPILMAALQQLKSSQQALLLSSTKKIG